MTRLRARLRALPSGMARALRIAGILILGLIMFGLAFGLPPTLLTDTAAAIVSVVVVVSLLPASELSWPASRDESVSHGWSQLSMLSHGIAVADSSPWEFDAAVRPRLRRLADAALARRGIDWDGHEAVALLGPDVHAALSAPLASTGTRTSLAQATLDALDRLEPADRREPADPTRSVL